MPKRRMAGTDHCLIPCIQVLFILCTSAVGLTCSLCATELNWTKKGKGAIALIGEGRAQLWSRSTGVLGSLARHNKTWLRERKLEIEDYRAKAPGQIHEVLKKENDKLATVLITVEHEWVPAITADTIAAWGTWSTETGIPVHLIGPGLEGENFHETKPHQENLEAANQALQTMATEAGINYINIRQALIPASKNLNTKQRKYGGVTSNGSKLNRDGIAIASTLIGQVLGMQTAAASKGSKRGQPRSLTPNDIIAVIQDTLWSKHAGGGVPLGNRWVSQMIEDTKGFVDKHGRTPAFIPRRYDHFGTGSKDEISSILNIQGKEETLAQTAGETIVILALSYAVNRKGYLKAGGQKALDAHLAQHKPAWIKSIKKFTDQGQMVVIVGVPGAEEKIADLKKTGYDTMFKEVALQTGAVYVPLPTIKAANEAAGTAILKHLGWHKPGQ